MAVMERQWNECIAVNGIDAARLLKRRKSLGIDRALDTPVTTHDQMNKANQSFTFNYSGINSTLLHHDMFGRYLHMYSSFLGIVDRSTNIPYHENHNSAISVKEPVIMKQKCKNEPKKNLFSVESLLK